MKKLIFIFVAVIGVLFAACEKNEMIFVENENLLQAEEGYIFENGYIKFKDSKTYLEKYEALSNAESLDIDVWNRDLPFKSLLIKHEKELVEYEQELLNDLNDKNREISVETKFVDKGLFSLFNENGVLLVGDTIMKIYNNHIYTITNGDFSLLEQIGKSDLARNPNVLKHEYFQSFENDSNGILKVVYSDRSNMYYHTNTRRFYVNFEGGVYSPLFSKRYFKAEMQLRFQKKLGFVWLTPTDADLSSGRIKVESYDYERFTGKELVFDKYGVSNMRWSIDIPVDVPIFTKRYAVSYEYNKYDKLVGTKLIIHDIRVVNK